MDSCCNVFVAVMKSGQGQNLGEPKNPDSLSHRLYSADNDKQLESWKQMWPRDDVWETR